MKVLVVEDDPTSLQMLSTMVKKLHHDVLTAVDGAEAFTLFKQEFPPIVITDWMMPNMDGLQLCRQIRQQKGAYYTYIIIVTAKTGKWSFKEGMEAGADDFLNKPVDMEHLVARIKVAERILLFKK